MSTRARSHPGAVQQVWRFRRGICLQRGVESTKLNMQLNCRLFFAVASFCAVMACTLGAWPGQAFAKPSDNQVSGTVCGIDLGEGSYEAVFGYENDGGELEIPIGPSDNADNSNIRAPQYRHTVR
jgi:hypothetical protein